MPVIYPGATDTIPDKKSNEQTKPVIDPEMVKEIKEHAEILMEKARSLAKKLKSSQSLNHLDLYHAVVKTEHDISRMLTIIDRMSTKEQ